MVFASICEHASSAFIFASTSGDQICLASRVNTLENTDGEQRARRKLNKPNRTNDTRNRRYCQNLYFHLNYVVYQVH